MCVSPKTCKNTIGSFTCEGEDVPNYPPGFHFKSSTQACAGNIKLSVQLRVKKRIIWNIIIIVSDFEECLTGENDCNKESQECLNTKGNYTCVDKASRNTCPPGFKKNFKTELCEGSFVCFVNGIIQIYQ